MKKHMYRRWGVFNYDSLWDVFYQRKYAREYIMTQLEIDERGLQKRLRDGSISIEKVVVRKRKWKGQHWSTKP